MSSTSLGLAAVQNHANLLLVSIPTHGDVERVSKVEYVLHRASYYPRLFSTRQRPKPSGATMSSARLSGGSGVRAVDLVCTMAIRCIFL